MVEETVIRQEEALIEQYKSLPLKAQAQQEGWHICRSDIEWRAANSPLAETARYKMVRAARWRGTPVAVRSVEEIPSNRSPERMREVEQEVKIVSTLRHPSLVQFLGCSLEDQANPILLYELLSGGTLLQYVESARELGPWKPAAEHVLRWAKQLSQGLSFLHGNDPALVHGRFNPSNIFVDEELQCLKLGIGFRMADQPDDGMSDTSTHSISDWDTVYTAPEVLAGSVSRSMASDIYSFGRVIHFIITGHHPGSHDCQLVQKGKKFRALGSLLNLACGPENERPSAEAMVEELKEIERGISGKRQLRLHTLRLTGSWMGRLMNGSSSKRVARHDALTRAATV